MPTLHPAVHSRISEYAGYIRRLLKQNDQVERAAKVAEATGARLYLGTPIIWLNIDVNAFSEVSPAIREAYRHNFAMLKDNRFEKDNAGGSVYYHLVDTLAENPEAHALTIHASLKVGANGCKRVKVGERVQTIPIYEIRCGSPTDLPEVP